MTKVTDSPSGYQALEKVVRIYNYSRITKLPKVMKVLKAVERIVCRISYILGMQLLAEDNRRITEGNEHLN